MMVRKWTVYQGVRLFSHNIVMFQWHAGDSGARQESASYCEFSRRESMTS